MNYFFSTKLFLKRIWGIDITKKEYDTAWKEVVCDLRNELIDTGSVGLEPNVGHIKIYKERIANAPLIVKMNKIKDTLSVNRSSYYYKIVFEPSQRQSNVVKFIPSRRLVKERDMALLNSNKDYKPAPLRNVNK